MYTNESLMFPQHYPPQIGRLGVDTDTTDWMVKATDFVKKYWGILALVIGVIIIGIAMWVVKGKKKPARRRRAVSGVSSAPRRRRRRAKSSTPVSGTTKRRTKRKTAPTKRKTTGRKKKARA